MWFNDIFLPSIFRRAGTGKPLWLTQKQTAICTDNMAKNVVSYSDGVHSYRHYNYSYVWNGRKVILSYSKKNGCGTIEFGMNEEEQKAAAIARKEEKRRIELETVERAKRNPDRLKKRIEKLRNEEQVLLDNLSFDDNSEEYVKIYTERLAEIRRLLTLYQS